jgi:Protein of unknown function (DUF1439)
MTKRRLAWIAIVALGTLALLGALWNAFSKTTIVLTATQLQERANRELPRDFKGVTVERTGITIAEGRIALRVEIRTAAFGQVFAAAVFARGVPFYEAERGELYFDADDVKVESFKAVEGSLAQRLDTRLGERIEAAAGKAITAGLKSYLAARPVYRFKDDFKGIVLKAAVTDIAIQGDTVVIPVSLINLTVAVATYLFIVFCVLAFMFYLVRHPGWGLSILDAVTGASMEA